VALYLHSPNTFSWDGAKLKHSDNFTFIFLVGDWIHLAQDKDKSQAFVNTVMNLLVP
jgi:hypothetical protein